MKNQYEPLPSDPPSDGKSTSAPNPSSSNPPTNYDDYTRATYQGTAQQDPNQAAYVSYQNAPPPQEDVNLNHPNGQYASYQGLPPSPPPKKRTARNYKDFPFAVFFWTYFFFGNSVFFRVYGGASLDNWAYTTTPLWTLYSGLWWGTVWAVLWYYVLWAMPRRVAVYERNSSVGIFAFVPIGLAYTYQSYTDITTYFWVWFFWGFTIFRIIWDQLQLRGASTEKEEFNNRFTLACMESTKSIVIAFAPCAIICIGGHIFWLGWWSFAYSVSCIITASSTYLLETFPAAQSLLLLVLFWGMGVTTSMLKNTIGSCIAEWYVSEGRTTIQSKRFGNMIQSMISPSHQGSIVFAGTFVPFCSILSSLLRSIQNLFDSRSSLTSNSVLLKACKGLEYSFNSTCYISIIPSDKPFIESCHIGSDLLESSGMKKILKCNTLKYHIFWISCQSFGLALASSGSTVAGIMAFLLTYTLTNTINTTINAILHCCARDINFLKTQFPNLSNEIIAKLSAPAPAKVDNVVIESSFV